MSLYVLDTDILSLMFHSHESVCRHVLAVPADDLAVTIINVDELLSGWYSQVRKARRDEQRIRAYAALQNTVQFLGDSRILPFDLTAVRHFHSIRSLRLRTGTNDQRIAAIVLTHSGILVTRNSQDFIGIPGLQFEDWTHD